MEKFVKVSLGQDARYDKTHGIKIELTISSIDIKDYTNISSNLY